MSRLLIVSNRLPVSVVKTKRGLRFQSSVGGLATGLRTFYKSYDATWIGWPDIDPEEIKNEENTVKTRLQTESCHPVFLSEEDIKDYYHGFSNNTIWPLFHYFPQNATYSEDLWQAYKRVNKTFADTVVDLYQDDDIIWVHDYQLMLLPQLLRQRLPKAKIGFFLHIPFPSFEILRMLPWRREILEGLLGADLVGFHTYDYVSHFLDSLHNLLGYEATLGQITIADRTVKAEMFPMGIDYERYSNAPLRKKVQTEVSKFRAQLGNNKVILSIDRLDYTKGILQRLAAYSLLLERSPEHREKLVLVMVVVPSRIALEQYTLLKRQLDELVGDINSKYGTIGWTPIWYLYRTLPFNSLIALYSMADIALVTPIRDGMNLVAKEYLATKTDGKGVLILSETAGAARELGEAIIVNVNNQEEIVQALEWALAVPEEEQIEVNRIMQKRLQRYNVKRWAEEFIDRLLQTKKLQEEMGMKMLSHEARGELISDFIRSNQRLIILDYDGTLVPFSGRPEWAMPGNEVTGLLKGLAGDSRNEVILISGRIKDTMEKWFGGLGINLIAEHGALGKERDGEWQLMESLTNKWKEEVRPILEVYVDRTPGSFVEEKEFSIAWHYRRAAPWLGQLRARELVQDLLNLTANLNLRVVESNMVVEVKSAGIDKGRAVSQWFTKKYWDFILAIGDAQTDEDIFKIIPDMGWSIKVRFGASAAKYNIASVNEVRSLLREMVKSQGSISQTGD